MITVPTDSPSIFNALNTLVVSDKVLAIVRPDNPPPGIAGFIFDVVQEDRSDLECDITDHFLEDQTAVQDHIALRPEVVTISGLVAEVVQKVDTEDSASSTNNPLPLVDSLSPELSPDAERSEDEVLDSLTDNLAAVASNDSLYSYYLSKSPQQPNQSKQSEIYGYFYQLMKGKRLFTVETPWGFFVNMALASLSARQPDRTKDVTEFTATFKKIRVSQAITVNSGQLAGRAVFQQAPVTQNGTIGQVPVTSIQQQQFNQKIQPFTPPPVQ